MGYLEDMDKNVEIQKQRLQKKMSDEKVKKLEEDKQDKSE